MKIRRIIKKGLSIVMSLALMLTLLLNVGVVEPKAAGISIKIGILSLSATGDAGALYYKNGDTSTLTGTADSYNAKLEWDANGTTLTLNGLDLNEIGSYPISSSAIGDLTLVLEGTNSITKIPTDLNMISEYQAISMSGVNLTVKGTGTLDINSDMVTYGTGYINVNHLYLTDSAKVNINVDKIYSNSNSHGVVAYNGVKLDGSSSLNIEMGGTSSSASYMYGISSSTSSGKIEILGNSNLSIKTATANSANYGIECNDFDMSTTGNVIINTGETACYSFGISTTTLDVTDGTLDVTVGKVSDYNNATGILSQRDVAIAGDAIVNVIMNGGNWPNGITTSIGNLTMAGTAALNVNLTSINNYATAVDMNNVTLSGSSKIDITTGNPGQSSYGIGKTTSEITLSDSASIKVDLGDGTVESKGMKASSLKMSGSSSIEISAGQSGNISCGITANNVEVNDKAKLKVTAGNATTATSGASIAIWTSTESTVSSDATVIATAGTGAGESTAIKTDTSWEIGGGTVEAISSGKAFSNGVMLDETNSPFEVKAGSSASSAAKQTATQMTDSTTYTDNAYVLIRAVEIIHRVDLSDIDELVHGESADTTAKTDTEGVGLKIPVTWAPTGDIVGGTEYIGTITITPIDGYVFADDVEVYYGSEKLTTALQADGSVTATYKQTAQKTELVSVENPDDVTGVANGTALKDIPLPEKTAITTASGSDEANITWDLTSVNYDPTSKEEQTFTVSGTIVAPNYVYTSNVNLNVSIKVTVKAAATTATTEEPTTTSTEDTTTQAPATTSTEDVTTQAPGGSMTDTEAPTTATTATTTEAPDNSDANVKTGDSAPLNVMLVLMLLAGIGMIVVGKKKSE